MPGTTMNQYRVIACPPDCNGTTFNSRRGQATLLEATANCGEPFAEAVEAAGFGVVLVAEDGWIIFANSAASELMRRREGLRSASGWLAAATAEVTVRLRAFIASGAKLLNGAPPPSATIALEREHRRPLFAQVVILRRHRRETPGAAPPAAAAIFIMDPERYAVPWLDAFSALYGLTAAEMRVLDQIVDGKGLVAAARTLRVTEATARTHLQRIFDKTGTKRQTELLCRYFKGMPPG
jgi:DNA-binding CsgD family transcriptional regulator